MSKIRKYRGFYRLLKVSRVSTLTGASYYLFDGDTAILEGATPDLANPTAYLAGINGLLAKISPEGIMAYYYYDAQGNLGAITDEAGNITGTIGYDASDEKYAYVGKYGVTMEPDDDLLMKSQNYHKITEEFLVTCRIISDISQNMPNVVTTANIPNVTTTGDQEFRGELLFKHRVTFPSEPVS